MKLDFTHQFYKVPNVRLNNKVTAVFSVSF